MDRLDRIAVRERDRHRASDRKSCRDCSAGTAQPADDVRGVDADANVLPAGIGSAIVTPAVPGLIFVTTIVQVMFPPPSYCESREPTFVIAKSGRGATNCSSMHTLFVALLFASPPNMPCTSECSVR